MRRPESHLRWTKISLLFYFYESIFRVTRKSYISLSLISAFTKMRSLVPLLLFLVILITFDSSDSALITYSRLRQPEARPPIGLTKSVTAVRRLGEYMKKKATSMGMSLRDRDWLQEILKPAPTRNLRKYRLYF